MGMMPPFDPSSDPSLTWVVVKVLAVDPVDATWSRPARVSVELVKVQKQGGPVVPISVGAEGPATRDPTPIPQTFDVRFQAPRIAGQSRFYVIRENRPDQREQLERLDRTPLSLPAVGDVVVTCLSESAPGTWTAVDLQGSASFLPYDPEAGARRDAEAALAALPWWRRLLARLGLART